MPEPGKRVRLRQAVIVAAELEPVVRELRRTLDLGEPHRDPGIAEFGLVNAVLAIGDCFIEVVSPEREETAAGRYLARHGGDGGYMALFDLEDLESARARVAQEGIRVVWRIDLPDISGTHLHPADMRGAIVSLDRSDPYGSWRWGGPAWTGRVGEPTPGRLVAVTVAVREPATVAARWARVLGVALDGGERPKLALDGGEVRFATAREERAEGIVEIALADVPGLGAAGVEVGGVLLRAADAR
jgi:Glyoxalase-like domain